MLPELDEVESLEAGAVADDDSVLGELGEVDCCLEQATRASALRHTKRRLRCIRSPQCVRFLLAGNRAATRGHITLGRKRRSMARPHYATSWSPSAVIRTLPVQVKRRAAGESRANLRLFLGRSALLVLAGGIFRPRFAERAFINLTAATSAVSLAHASLRSPEEAADVSTISSRSSAGHSARRAATESRAHRPARPGTRSG